MTAAVFDPTSSSQAGPQQGSHLRLTRRGRLVITALVATPLVVSGVLAVLNGGVATATVEGPSATLDYVRVEPGQSLWQLAESLAPGADPREVVADISDLNRLDTAVVQPGQRLAIPVEYAE
ncbi:MAG: hypothetical protein RI885_1582 [Actinomycetota bacterium]|jgi:LysM repeat protein